MTYSAINVAMEGVQKLAPNSTTCRVIFDKQNLGRADPARIGNGAFLSPLWELGLGRFDCLGWRGIWYVVNVLAVHGIDSIRLAHRINEVVNILVAH
jgi:hypothetical protein